jgi:hypothetical protein
MGIVSKLSHWRSNWTCVRVLISNDETFEHTDLQIEGETKLNHLPADIFFLLSPDRPSLSTAPSHGHMSTAAHTQNTHACVQPERMHERSGLSYNAACRKVDQGVSCSLTNGMHGRLIW